MPHSKSLFPVDNLGVPPNGHENDSRSSLHCLRNDVTDGEDSKKYRPIDRRAPRSLIWTFVYSSEATVSLAIWLPKMLLDSRVVLFPFEDRENNFIKRKESTTVRHVHPVLGTNRRSLYSSHCGIKFFLVIKCGQLCSVLFDLLSCLWSWSVC